MKISGRKTALTYAGAESKFGMTCEKATPRAANAVTPSARNAASASQSCGQGRPKNTFPATTMSATSIAALVMALATIPPR